jgi:uncharacterized membrane protein YidH (DUF202 family)
MRHICSFFDAANPMISCYACYDFMKWTRTSKAIQLIGSSLGMSVFFTSSSFSISSSNATVMMTPGGVHVPIMRWCLTMLAVILFQDATPSFGLVHSTGSISKHGEDYRIYPANPSSTAMHFVVRSPCVSVSTVKWQDGAFMTPKARMNAG